jgi:hypothetical protein
MRVIVKQPAEKEIPTEVLAASIVTISDAMKKLRAGRLADRALWLLIQDACSMKLGMREISAVLEAVAELERLYVKKKI